MFIFKTVCLKLLLKICLVNFWKSVLEQTVILLQYGVFRWQTQWHFSCQWILETSACKTVNWVVCVKHSKIASTFLEFCHFLGDCFTSIVWGKLDFNFSWFCYNVILASILITKCMSSNNDWLYPAWNESGDVWDNDGLTEYCTIKDISNCTVRAFPHLSQIKFFYTFSIRSNSCALDSYFMFLDCISTVNSNLIFSFVTVLNT